MNKKTLALLIISILILLDQASKIYIKLTMYMGEHFFYLGDWASIHFVENEGMAFGLSFGGGIGKILLTTFRMVVVSFIADYIFHQIKQNKANSVFIICLSIIFAGAIGNIIDSIFYGVIFNESTPMQIATIFPEQGYAPLLKGKVVDMFYFPLYQGNLPEWVPIFGGKAVDFFPYIFNLADAYITVGVALLLIFQKKILH